MRVYLGQLVLDNGHKDPTRIVYDCSQLVAGTAVACLLLAHAGWCEKVLGGSARCGRWRRLHVAEERGEEKRGRKLELLADDPKAYIRGGMREGG